MSNFEADKGEIALFRSVIYFYLNKYEKNNQDINL